VKANIEVYCYMIVWRFLRHSEWGAGGVECSKSPQRTKNTMGPPMSSVDLKQLSYPSFHIFSVLAAQARVIFHSLYNIQFSFNDGIKQQHNNYDKRKKVEVAIESHNMTKKKIKYCKESAHRCNR